jgi:hypothetical protein
VRRSPSHGGIAAFAAAGAVACSSSSSTPEASVSDAPSGTDAEPTEDTGVTPPAEGGHSKAGRAEAGTEAGVEAGPTEGGVINVTLTGHQLRELVFRDNQWR